CLPIGVQVEGHSAYNNEQSLQDNEWITVCSVAFPENPTHWMVQTANFLLDSYERNRREEGRDDGTKMESERISAIELSDSRVSGHSDSLNMTEKKDRRVLDFMIRFKNDREIRTLFREKEPSADRIIQIFDR
ncbi:hypothetical protein PENTCL1PPCAC_1147, partial [Pristionchus entomophagus]